MSSRRKKRLTHDQHVFLLALGAGAPAVLATLLLLRSYVEDAKVAWTVGAIVVLVWLFASVALRERVLRPLQTAANLVAALREEDFSVRGREARPGDPVGELLLEINQLADSLHAQRVGSLEAGALLRRVMDEIEVAVLAFDAQGRAALANRAAEKLLGIPLSRLLEAGGLDAGRLRLEEALAAESPRVMELNLPGASGRFEVRRSTFRMGGLPHQLLVLSDLRRALREEERLAWQRLVRVLGHEINNSLAPIHSISSSLKGSSPEDLEAGLAVIERRAEGLMRFMNAYTRLARLPPPQLGEVDVPDWVNRVASLEKRIAVSVREGPAVSVRADADQLEQLLINLIRNAADAALETGGGVEVTWSIGQRQIEICVADEGPGVTSTANLFVPFFTTKAGGSGIGLALSRQIAEAHQGSLALENRRDRRGARARLRLPL
ncbi:MAG: HAMP domain-containing protein [Deltaproteobacteria bacterium]|nr:MAG: HAMP domain-containing protein [Deltaproteobacteria bacterium]